MAIKFKELKHYISRIVRISVSFEDRSYENYTLKSDIPEGKYDEMYICGVGMIEVEFSKDVYAQPETEPYAWSRGADYFMVPGLEVYVWDRPREGIDRKNEEALQFGDLRNYLQRFGNFSVVMREDWSSKEFEYQKDIPQEYNELFVYGIGMEDNPKMKEDPRFLERDHECVIFKRMVIVLSKEPRRMEQEKADE